MKVNARLWSLLLTVLDALKKNDVGRLERLAMEQSEDLFSCELQTLARIRGQPNAVCFLATLAAENGVSTNRNRLIIDIYKSLIAKTLIGSVSTISTQNVLRATISYINNENREGPIDWPRGSHSGSAADWLLSIELALEWDRDQLTLFLVNAIPIDLLDAEFWLEIVGSFLSRQERVHKFQSLARAEALEKLYLISPIGAGSVVQDKLALVIAESFFYCRKYEHSLSWSERISNIEESQELMMHIAKTLCYSGRIKESIGKLDQLIDVIVKKTIDWSDVSLEQKEGTSAGKFPLESARRALSDLQAAFTGSDKKIFLVFGTLLGMMREGDFIKHDKDIDVGILAWQDQFEIAETILRSKKFYVDYSGLRGSNAYYMWVVHLDTNIGIDIFVHHESGEAMETGINYEFGHFQRFGVSKFKLQEKNFLGMSFYVPENSERYLSEVYGQWQIPDRDFTDLESPALRDVGGIHFLIEARLHMISAMQNKRKEKARRIFNILNRYIGGESGGLSRTAVDRIGVACGFVH